MKKLLMVLALAGMSLTGFAQDETPVLQHSVATNSFWSNWFIQAGANWNVWYSGQEHSSNNSTSPFEKFRSNPGAAVAIGKWFTPGIGLRTKLQGIWGKTVYEGNKSTCNKFWTLNEHVLFNVSNMILGYNPKRVWDLIPFAGAGMTRSMTTDLYGMQLSVGLLNEFHVSRKVAVNVEVGWNRQEGDADGVDYASVGNRGWDCHDNYLYAEVGLTYNLGKATWSAVPDVDAINAQHQAALDALNAKLRDAEAENARLRDALANQKPVENTNQAIHDLVTTPVSVFFNLDKTNIASKKDLVNVQAIAKYAQENDRNILVTGYADSATGTPKHNQWLSEQRANTVANEIQKMGVSSSKITTVGKGGVDTLSPISFNRRATVQIAE